MNTRVQQTGAAVLTGLLVLGGFAPATWAAPYRPYLPTAPAIPINPNYNIAPGLSLRQAAYNTAVMGRAVSNIPPYALGYNPYTSPVISSGPVVNSGGYPSPLMTGVGYGSPTLSTYPGLGYGAGGYPSSATLSTNPLGGYDAAAAAPGYGGYGVGGYGEDPTAGFLRGTSDVINATGNYYKNVQSARLIQTQADESRIDYRRRLIDEARYERMNLLTTEELRQQQLRRDLSRSRHEPPIEEIASGKSLNDLLHHLTNDPARPKGPNVPLDDEVMQRINVTGPTATGASVGLLKDEGNLQWPQALKGHEFDEPRKNLEAKMVDAVQALKFNNTVKQGDLNDLNLDLKQLRTLVEKSELSPTDYIAAKDYLDQVASAILALENPDVIKYFNHKFNAKNVAELVDDMRTKGLDFAAAAPGDAGAYRALHQALVAYDYGVSPQQPSSSPPPAPAPAPPQARMP